MARRRRYTDDPTLDDGDDVSLTRRARRRGGRRWKLLLLLAALAAIVAAAPTIVAKSPLRDALLAKALPATAGKLTARDAAFSWTGGQGLAGVALIDAKGTQQLSAELVQTSRSLLGLLAGGNDFGLVTVTRPILAVETRAGGSNLEDFIAQLAEAAASAADDPSNGSRGPKRLEVAIVDGTIVGSDSTTGQTWSITGLSATAKPLEGGGWDILADGTLKLGAPNASNGNGAERRPIGAIQDPSRNYQRCGRCRGDEPFVALGLVDRG
jgi:translocation and assembly module TamB